MIRPDNRLFWLAATLSALVLAIVIVAPLRQAFGALVWDPIIVPLYANSRFLIDNRVLLCGLVLLFLITAPFLFSPLWELIGILDNVAMALARTYYNSRFVHYPVDSLDQRHDRDPYAAVTRTLRRIGYGMRFMRAVPFLGDLHNILFDDMPSSRVALLLLNRIHEAHYVIALGKDSAKTQQRWDVALAAAQELIGHTLAGPGLAPTRDLIGALLLDDLNSQSYVMAARYGVRIPARVAAWRQLAARLYRRVGAALPAESPWSVWITLRLLWLDLFGSSGLLDWSGLSVVEAQFWRLTELADNETGFGIAIAGAHRLANDLAALRVLGNSPGAPDLLRFGTDLGYWLDSTSDALQATVWHNSPSSRASELPPIMFLAAQLIEDIGPKWAKPGQLASDALRGQLIAARGAIYPLIQSGWQGMVTTDELIQAQSLAERAADELMVEDEFGGKA